MHGGASIATISGVRARPPSSPLINRRPPCSKVPRTHPSPNLEHHHSVHASTVSHGDHCHCSCPEITVTRKAKDSARRVTMPPGSKACSPPTSFGVEAALLTVYSPRLQGPSPSDMCSDHVPTCYQVLVADMCQQGPALGLCVGTPILRGLLLITISLVLPFLSVSVHLFSLEELSLENRLHVILLLRLFNHLNQAYPTRGRRAACCSGE